MRALLSRDLFTIENAPPGGGVPVVTLPPAPVAPPQMAPAPVPIPTPTLPSPPSPILPTPGIDIADEFQFDVMVLGNPGSPAEALELLGIEVFEMGSPSFTSFPGLGGPVRITHHPDGSVTYARPEPVVTLSHDLWD